MSTTPADIPVALFDERVLTPLRRLRHRLRLYVAAEGALRLGLAVVGACLLQMLLDWWLRLGIEQRAVLNGLITLLWLVVALRVLVRPLMRLPDEAALALIVDRSRPALHDRIASAVQFARGEIGPAVANSPVLVREVIREACEAARDVPFLDVLDHRRARRRTIELAALAVATLAAFVVVPSVTRTWFARNWLLRNLDWPRQTRIIPQGFDAGGLRRLPRGDTFEVVAVNRGRVPKTATLSWWTDTGRRGDESMVRIGAARWQIALGRLTENVHFRIRGGDERTRVYTVVAVDRPSVTRTSVRVIPPAYTGLTPLTLEQQTVLEVPRGAQLAIDAQLSGPVVAAHFTSDAGTPVPCTLVDPRHVRVEWADPASGSYHFELADRDGWKNIHPVRYTLRVLPDRPPQVSLDLPDVGERITPAATLPGTLRVEDTYGLSRVRVMVQRADAPPREVDGIPSPAGRRMVKRALSLAVARFGVRPGDRLRVWAEAADTDPHGPNVARSRVVTLRVVSAADLLDALAARERELRRDFERLLSAQRGLSDALQRALAGARPGLPPSERFGQRLVGLARRQAGHARNVLTVRRGFAQILAQMRINDVVRAGEERRLSRQIINPLRELGRRVMPAASETIATIAERVEPASTTLIATQQAEIVRRMRAVLANMRKWEGYRQAVAMLEEIIETQKAVHTQTVEQLRRELEDILGPGAVPDSQPAPPGGR